MHCRPFCFLDGVNRWRCPGAMGPGGVTETGRASKPLSSGAVDSGREFFHNDFLHLGWMHGFYMGLRKFESSLDYLLVLAPDLVLSFLRR